MVKNLPFFLYHCFSLPPRGFPFVLYFSMLLLYIFETLLLIPPAAKYINAGCHAFDVASAEPNVMLVTTFSFAFCLTWLTQSHSMSTQTLMTLCIATWLWRKTKKSHALASQRGWLHVRASIILWACVHFLQGRLLHTAGVCHIFFVKCNRTNLLGDSWLL